MHTSPAHSATANSSRVCGAGAGLACGWLPAGQATPRQVTGFFAAGCCGCCGCGCGCDCPVNAGAGLCAAVAAGVAKEGSEVGAATAPESVAPMAINTTSSKAPHPHRMLRAEQSGFESPTGIVFHLPPPPSDPISISIAAIGAMQHTPEPGRRATGAATDARPPTS